MATSGLGKSEESRLDTETNKVDENRTSSLSRTGTTPPTKTHSSRWQGQRVPKLFDSKHTHWGVVGHIFLGFVGLCYLMVWC